MCRSAGPCRRRYHRSMAVRCRRRRRRLLIRSESVRRRRRRTFGGVAAWQCTTGRWSRTRRAPRARIDLRHPVVAVSRRSEQAAVAGSDEFAPVSKSGLARGDATRVRPRSATSARLRGDLGGLPHQQQRQQQPVGVSETRPRRAARTRRTVCARRRRQLECRRTAEEIRSEPGPTTSGGRTGLRAPAAVAAG